MASSPSRRQVWRSSVLLLVLLAGSTGCLRGLGGLGREPEVTVDHVLLRLEEAPPRAVLALVVDNPYGGPLQVNQLDWELWLEGRYFAAGTQAVEFRLEPRERRSLEVELPVRVRFATLSGPKDAQAAARGFLQMEGPGGERRMGFERELWLSRVMVPGFTPAEEQ